MSPGNRMLTLFLTLFSFFCIHGMVSAAESGEACATCHERTTPVMVHHWRLSSHAKEGVDCQKCHGDYVSNHDLPSGTRPLVEAALCASCHAVRAREHFAGKHGIGFRAGQACTRNKGTGSASESDCGTCHEPDSGLPREKAECARFLAQSPEMQRQGCNACHQIENRCDTCHTAHDTNLETARDPSICATCHMGPDHAQYEMWKTSKHGILHNQFGSGYAPDCMTCHMPDGNHDVSAGISMGLAGQPYAEEKRATERAGMVSICMQCHTKAFSEKALADADAIQKQSKALLDEAAAIIRELNDEGLILPAPGDRPPHPLSGPVLEIGPQMLYENLSAVEAEFFRMKKFHYVTAYKGAFHQNPDYAHWYGNAPLKLSLSWIRSQAELLRKVGRLQGRMDNLAVGGDRGDRGPGEGPGQLDTSLRQLKERFLSGKISQDEYDRERAAILDRSGL